MKETYERVKQDGWIPTSTTIGANLSLPLSIGAKSQSATFSWYVHNWSRIIVSHSQVDVIIQSIVGGPAVGQSLHQYLLSTIGRIRIHQAIALTTLVSPTLGCSKAGNIYLRLSPLRWADLMSMQMQPTDLNARKDIVISNSTRDTTHHHGSFQHQQGIQWWLR